MIFIAHRGNYLGTSPDKENRSYHIAAALAEGFDVEVDIILYQGQLYLGHDIPHEPITYHYLQNERFWCHAKTVETFISLIEHGGINTFFHDVDAVTLTTTGYLWTYPGQPLGPKSICVMPEKVKMGLQDGCYAICSDYVASLRRHFHDRLRPAQICLHRGA